MRNLKTRVGAFSALVIVAMGANMLPAAAYTFSAYPAATADGAVEQLGTVSNPEACATLLSGADASGKQIADNSYGYTSNTPGAAFGSYDVPADLTAGNDIDGRWVSDEHASAPLVFQLSGTGAQFVDLFNVIDHVVIGATGDPQNGEAAPEAMESSLFAVPALAGGGPNPDQSTWSAAKINTIFDQGRNASRIWDDYVRRWDLGAKYQYVGVTAGGVKAMRDDGDAEIDAVCAPTIPADIPPPPTTGQIAPTQTTCQAYASSTAADLNQVLYNAKGTTIGSAAPGVLFYYSKFTATATSSTIDITQSNSNPGVPLFDPQNITNLRVFDAACTELGGAVTKSTSGGQVKITTPTTVGATYIVSVKYSTASVVGAPVPTPSTVHYDFKTLVGAVQVNSDANGLDLVKK